ncbi:sensor histidine kinase [Actinokineospora sp. G85]|uniref:sensor histidine kinase n=1 Tax=Actinokineospora sp. G85 TaxID=3406626 RepID=UPI003C70EA77
MSPTREPLWTTRRQALFYLLPVPITLALWVVFSFVVAQPDSVFDWVDAAIAPVLVLALVVRAWFPRALLAALAAMTVLYLVVIIVAQHGGGIDINLGEAWVPVTTPFVVYNAVLHVAPTVAGPVLAAVTAIAARPWELSANVMLGAVLAVLVPALIGLFVRANRGLVRALTDRAERAEREQHLVADRARAEERVRLAGEMHDVVTHRVSLMVVHAGALGATAPDDRVRAAAEGLRVAGCEALDELRELVGVLRNGDEQAAPPASDLADLVADSAAAGVPVDLVVEGDPAPTSAAVARTAHRVVQEALTNIRKHAPGAATTVRVHHTADSVRLTVRNGPATAPVDQALSATGSGAGLVGLRQRVELLGGALDAGPRGRGFQVEAVLPAHIPLT